MQGHLEVAKKLLAAGADPNIAPDHGSSPLFIACEKGHSEIARKLLDAGADPHMARDDGASVFNTGSACDIQEFAGPGKNHTKKTHKTKRRPQAAAPATPRAGTRIDTRAAGSRARVR